MRKILFTLLTALMVLNISAQVKYDISGTVPTVFNGKEMYLLFAASQQISDYESTPITNGMFHFEGTNNSEDIACVTATIDGKDISCYFVLENAPVTIDFTGDTPIIKGGELNNKYNAYRVEQIALSREHNVEKFPDYQKEMQNNATTETRRNEIKAKLAKYKEDMLELSKKHVTLNEDNIVGAFLFLNIYNNLSIAEKDAILAKAGGKFKTYSPVESILQQMTAAKAKAIGTDYTDFKMADKDGVKHNLSEYVKNNKVTMVDFWASWCGPCRREMPYVKAAYEKYHNKGFEIVGISLDKDKASWLKAVEDLDLNWIQLSDLKYWQCAAARLYGINSIPASILIDQNGKIIAADLRGDNLSTKLEELFK
ncbi:MAG: redoxin family protein [Phocaeicola sp.]|uniref:redoxin family protein n=1 Tax=Phocaeicola sp. TaxID=2773926 RepID=UPI003FA0C31A